MSLGPAFDAMTNRLETYIAWCEANGQHTNDAYIRLNHKGAFLFSPGKQTYISAHATLESHDQDETMRLAIKDAAREWRAHHVVQSLFLNISFSLSIGPKKERNGAIDITRGQHDTRHKQTYLFGPQKFGAKRKINTLSEATGDARSLLASLFVLPCKPTDPLWVFSYSYEHTFSHPFHAPDLKSARDFVANFLSPAPQKGTLFQLPLEEKDAFIGSNLNLRPF